MLRPRSTSLLIASLLAACGGGGGGGDTVGVCTPSASPASLAGSLVPKEVSTKIGTEGSPAVYTDKNSYLPGETIRFHGGTIARITDPTFQFRIMRMGAKGGPDPEPGTWAEIPAFAPQSPGPDGWEDCCDWPEVHSFTIPSDWESGLYWAKVSLASDGEVFSEAFFVVRAADAGTEPDPNEPRIVVSVPFTTAYAYDNWGGKSVYDGLDNSSAGERASRVSLSRPFAGKSRDKLTAWLDPFIRWAQDEGIALDFVANTDFHKDPKILDPYHLFLTVGHDEYWSSEMRGALERHLDLGGNAAFLSGNNMWWRIRFEGPSTGLPNGRMRVDKIDPQEGSTPPSGAAAEAHEGHWFWVDPEVKVFGAGYARGGWNRDGDAGVQPDYIVQKPDHWAFDGIPFTLGSAFGAANAIVNFEADGADFTYSAPGGPAIATHTDGAPATLDILAIAELFGWQSEFEEEAGSYWAGKSHYTGEPGRWATMVAYEHAGGGEVFNAATAYWAEGLKSCAAPAYECRITRNVIERLKLSEKSLAPSEPPPPDTETPAPAPAPAPSPAPAPAPAPAPSPAPAPPDAPNC